MPLKMETIHDLINMLYCGHNKRERVVARSQMSILYGGMTKP